MKNGPLMSMCQSSLGWLRSYRGPGVSNAATAAAVALEEFIDVAVADLVDLPAFHLGSNSLRVPVRRESNGDDDPAHPVRDSSLSLKSGARLGKQSGDATGFVESSPAKYAPS